MREMNKKALTVCTLSAMAIAIPLVQKWEGRELVAYKDVGGVWTYCDGLTNKKNLKLPPYEYTDEECDRLFEEELEKHADSVDELVKVDIPAETRAAFYSFHYNVGAAQFKSSTLLRLANEGDIEGACNQLSRWVFVKGKYVQGLANRRISEKGLCLEGIRENPWWGV